MNKNVVTGIKFSKILNNSLQNRGIFLEGHFEKITCVLITNNKNYILSSSFDCTIRLWNFFTLHQLFIFKGHRDSVNALALTSDDKYFISCSDDKSIIIWDFFERKIEYIIKDNASYVNCIAITRNNSYIISGNGFNHSRDDATVKVWDFQSRDMVRIFKGHKLKVNCVTSTYDNRYIISGSNDCNVRVWDFKRNRLKTKFKDHESYVICVSVTKNNKYVVSGSLDYTIRLWSIKKHQQVSCFRHPMNGSINCLIITNDQSFIISGSRRVQEQCLPDASEEFSSEEEGTDNDIKEENKSIIDCNLEVEKEINTNNAIEKESELKIEKCNYYSSIMIWNIKKKIISGCLEKFFLGVTSLDISTDNKHIAVALANNSILILDFEKEINIKIKTNCLLERIKFIKAVGKYYMIIATEDNCIRLWNINTKQQEAVLFTHKSKIKWIGSLKSGDYAFSYGFDKFMIYDINNKKSRRAVGMLEFISIDVTKTDKYFVIALNNYFFAIISIKETIKISRLKK